MSDKQVVTVVVMSCITILGTVGILVQQYFFASIPITCSCGDTVAQSVGFWGAFSASVIWAVSSATVTAVIAAIMWATTI